MKVPFPSLGENGVEKLSTFDIFCWYMDAAPILRIVKLWKTVALVSGKKHF